PRRNHHVDLVVVHDHAEAIGPLEPAESLEDALAREIELVPAAHGSGAVENEAEVRGWTLAVPRGAGASLWGNKLDEDEWFTAAGRTNEPAVGACSECVGCGHVGRIGVHRAALISLA